MCSFITHLYFFLFFVYELIMSMTLYFFDFRHAFFQIFPSLILEYIIQSISPYIYNCQYFSFFLALKTTGHLITPGILVNELF